MNATLRNLFGVATLAGLTLLVSPQFASGQAAGFGDAGAKIRDDAYWPGRATTRYVESARNYAQEFQTYVAKTPRPEPAVVAEVHKMLTGYFDEANKHLASMKKEFAGDNETVAAEERLEYDLATA